MLNEKNMEYFLTGIAVIAILLLIILVIINRKQEHRIKKNIKEIKDLKTGLGDSLKLFE